MVGSSFVRGVSINAGAIWETDGHVFLIDGAGGRGTLSGEVTVGTSHFAGQVTNGGIGVGFIQLGAGAGTARASTLVLFVGGPFDAQLVEVGQEVEFSGIIRVPSTTRAEFEPFRVRLPTGTSILAGAHLQIGATTLDGAYTGAASFTPVRADLLANLPAGTSVNTPEFLWTHLELAGSVNANTAILGGGPLSVVTGTVTATSVTANVDLRGAGMIDAFDITVLGGRYPSSDQLLYETMSVRGGTFGDAGSRFVNNRPVTVEFTTPGAPPEFLEFLNFGELRIAADASVLVRDFQNFGPLDCTGDLVVNGIFFNVGPLNCTGSIDVEGTFDNIGIISLDSGAGVTIRSGSVRNRSEFVITSGVDIQGLGSFENSGFFRSTGIVNVGARFVNTGVLDVNGQLSLGPVDMSGGEIRVSAGSAVRLHEDVSLRGEILGVGPGKLVVAEGAWAVDFNGTLLRAEQGFVYELAGGTVRTAPLPIRVPFRWTGGTMATRFESYSPDFRITSGTLTDVLFNAGTMTIERLSIDGGELVNWGLAEVLPGGFGISIGSVRNYGTFKLASGSAGGAFWNQGRLELGSDPPNVVGFTSFEQVPRGELRVPLGPSGNPQLFVIGTATLGGRLELVLEPGFNPPVGSMFSIVFGNYTGQFDSVTRGFSVTYIPSFVFVTKERGTQAAPAGSQAPNPTIRRFP